jgi:hypothetical protein
MVSIHTIDQLNFRFEQSSRKGIALTDSKVPDGSYHLEFQEAHYQKMMFQNNPVGLFHRIDRLALYYMMRNLINHVKFSRKPGKFNWPDRNYASDSQKVILSGGVVLVM